MRIGLNSKQTQNHFLFTRVLTIKNNASLWSWSIVFSTHTVIQGKLYEIDQIYVYTIQIIYFLSTRSARHNDINIFTHIRTVL